MTSRFFAIGLVGVLVAATVSSTVSPAIHAHLPRVAGTGQLHVYGTRSAAQIKSNSSAKFDSALADVSRHLASVRADHAISDLHALHPAARFRQPSGGVPLVLIDAVTRGDPQQLQTALVALGLQRPSTYSNDVSGWLPVAQLDAAAQREEVHAIRAAMPRTRSGVVTSQGDYVQRSDIVRSANAVDGTGVTVGILSDSYNCYPTYASNGVPADGNAGYANNGFNATATGDQSTGDLPAAASINIVEEADCLNYDPGTLLPFGDEGRAMMQIVHDVAPGAKLSFYTAENGEADFATGIGKLAQAGAKVIADDVGYFDEPFFQDGLIAQAIDTVKAGGVAYFSAAGNDGTQAYDNTAPSFATLSNITPTSGEHLLNFATTGTAVTSLPVTIPALIPGEFVAIVVEWDQPFVTGAPNSGGATSQINLCLTGVTGNDVIGDDNLDPLTSNCTGPNALGTDPVQIILVGNPTGDPSSPNNNSDPETINIVVGLAGGVTPGRVKVVIEDDGAGSVINSALATNGGTLQGHPGAAGAAAVGAAFYFDTPDCGTNPATIESFSSAGGDPILFDSTGTKLAAPLFRQKPDFVGPDGGNDTFLGYTLADAGFTGGQVTTSNASCKNVTTFPNFFGTSAATPHVASIAALFLQALPSLTPDQIYDALRTTALPMNGSCYSTASGFGFVQADAAAAAVPSAVPACPTLTATANAVAVNSPDTLNWSATNATSCTASGGWSGTLPTSGSQTVTPTTAGSVAYTLLCTNGTGNSASTTFVLTVTSVQPPAAPVLTLASSSITVGASTTITWSSSTASSCTASGAWTGALATSGTQTLTPTAAGTNTYSLTCNNSTGSSAATSVTLTVTAAASGGGHGGGSFDLTLLLALSTLLVIRYYSSNQRAR